MNAPLEPLHVSFKVVDLYERRETLPGNGISYHVVVEGTILDPSPALLRSISRQEWTLEEKRYRELQKIWNARTCDARDLVLRGALEIDLQVKGIF